MHGRRPRTVVLVICVGLLAATTAYGGGTTPTVLYRLGGESAFLEGCIEGVCLCPVRFASIGGTFKLTRWPDSDTGVQTFLVADVDWTTTGRSIVNGAITGSGTYTLGAKTHRLVLDLQIDSDPPVRVDSGEVPRAGVFPTIEIGGLTDSECYQ